MERRVLNDRLKSSETVGEECLPCIFRFGEFSLDLACGRLLTGMEDVHLRPKSLDVLTYLLTHAGQVISKTEFLDKIWPGLVVTEDSLTQCIHDVRCALKDKSHTMVRTVPRRGYLFPVDAISIGWPTTSGAKSEESRDETFPLTGPRMAMLPFAYPAEMANGRYFADGFVEDVIAGLSRFRRLFVIAHTTTSGYRDTIDNPAIAAHELNARYILEGSIRCAANRLRVSARLTNTDTKTVLWAEHFDTGLWQIFDVQDRMAACVVAAIIPHIQRAEIERARRKRPDNLQAYDLYLQALHAIRDMTSIGNERALDLAQRALALDPEFAAAAGLAAWALCLRIAQGWQLNPVTESSSGLDLGRRAIYLGTVHEDSEALALGGYAIAFLGEKMLEGLHAIERAITVNPCNAQAYTFSGWVRCYLGDATRAVVDFETTIQLSPRDATLFRTYTGLAFAKLVTGELESAADFGKTALELNPDFTPAHRVLASALGHLGRKAEAQVVVDLLLQLVPDLSIRRFAHESRFKYCDRLDFILEGLSLAGMPLGDVEPAWP